MFKISASKGFKIQFENGWQVSVQFGKYNYCQRRDDGRDGYSQIDSREEYVSESAEVAIIHNNGMFYKICPEDDVIGWQSAEDVAKWIEVARNLKPL